MRLMGLDADLPETQYQQGQRRGTRHIHILLRGLRVERSNQVWCGGYHLPAHAASGFLYLVAVMDWHTRKVLSWRISNTLEADFCIEALNEAIHKFGPPEIMNTDQGIPVHILRLDGADSAGRACGSRWMGKAVSWTTSSSRGCGAP